MINPKYIPAATVAAFILAACASIGRPEGGSRDFDAPRFVSSTPAPGQLNVTSGHISILFNENITLDDPGNKITISPAQLQTPKIQSNGRKISIDLNDTLIAGATYTIDLNDAVKDLNEGNVLDGFAIDFSTSATRDTLSISGMLLQAENLEPAQGMTVGLYFSTADTAITARRLDRITRTNHLGQFTLRNLPDTTVTLFALNDVNRDLHWDRSEDVAFYGEPIRPSATAINITDTLRATDGSDSLAIRTHTLFSPNDILLTWFNEGYKPQYLKNYHRQQRNILALEMNAPADSLAQLTVVAIGSQQVDMPLLDHAYLAHSTHNDTLNFWLTDTLLLQADSLLVKTTYRRVDSLDNIVWATDTLKFNHRRSKGQKPLRPSTLQERIDSIKAISDTIPIDTFALSQPGSLYNISLASTLQEINRPLIITTPTPLASIAPNGLKLQQCPDSVWIDVNTSPSLEPTSNWGTQFKIDNEWTPDAKYRLTIDSMAATDIYGLYNGKLNLEFKTRPLSDYSTLTFIIEQLPDSAKAYVVLLNDKDTPLFTLPLDGSTVTFEYLMPATYYARLFIDTDGDGKWTNGNLSDRLQPEDVYYFPKKLALKKNWQRTETWDILALPPDQQKPLEIKQNKPRKARNEQDTSPTGDDEDDEDNEFI